MSTLRAALLLALVLLAGPARAQDSNFAGFVASLRSDAAARGISQKTFDAAFADLRGPDPDVIARTRRQGEFSRPVWDYLVGAVSGARIARGQAQGKRLAGTLATIETKTGVPRSVVLAFWGVESDFGASAGSLPTVRALASLAYARYRGSLFRDELLAALQILENGDIEPARMVGSWAGAMGQVQFLPSVYLREAVDFDGDGRRDIWRSETDSLASIAHYLRSLGWKPGLSWGYEVSLPKDFDLTRYRGPLAGFAARGVRRTDGKPLPASGEASLFLPGGLGSPVFLITDNFEVIRGYNTSDSYALAVGHLADRLAGGPALAAAWPSGGARLDGPGLKRLQAGLAAQGLYAGEQDGRAGPKLREAVRQYQIREGLPADGYARPALLERLEGRP
ncbi:lytic murein transglycosylase [Methylobacterium sp. DM1]|nr:lytic murein transglycosylase [Methylobacterium sp. DM1]